MRVEVDADCCGGFGTCVTKAPTVFELTDDGYAVVILPDVPAELEDAVREAEVLCPTRAITVS
jgi:ferredoxin